jgi:hypothetical protein
MRYRLRTLLVVLAVGPPAIAVTWFFAFDMSAHDRSVFVQLLFLVLTAVAALALVWRVGAAISRKDGGSTAND